jgi:hypothetical protein
VHVAERDDDLRRYGGRADDPAGGGSLAEEDAQLQLEILGTLLIAHPARRSIEDVIHEQTDGSEDPMAHDDTKNAILELVGGGLLHRHGQFAFPTRAAVLFDELRG